MSEVTGWWAEYRDRFALSVPITVGMVPGGQTLRRELGINVPATISMDETHSYTDSFALDTPISISMGALGPEYAAIGLSVPINIQTSGVFVPGRTIYSDNFDRANNTSTLGPDWINRASNLGIRSNMAYNPTFSIAIAFWAQPLDADGQKVAAKIYNPAAGCYLFIACHAATGAGVNIWIGPTQMVITTHTGIGAGGVGGPTNRAVYNGSINSADEISVERAADSTVFILKQNGTTRATWDGGGVVSTGPDYRCVGLGLASQTPSWDNFTAEDM